MLVDKIYNLESFKRQYEALLILSVSDTIPKLDWEQSKQLLLEKIDWNNILSIASILCYSSNNQHLDAALRIAQTCLIQESCSKIQKNTSAFILECLTNKPSIQIALDRKYLHADYRDSYSLPLKLQQYQSEFEHTIIIENELIFLNRFQKEVYEACKNNETISISAPTSAGKSYILCTILLEHILSQKSNVIYVVPTRALISQVELDLRKLVKKYQLELTVNITTVPPQKGFDSTKSNIFIFTQERLHWFLLYNNVELIDLLIIDEAHKIEDGNRGILLQQKIEQIVQKNTQIKIYFSSPYTSNPEILLDNVLNRSKKEKINTQFVSVNQNLIYVSQKPRKPKEWELKMCTIEATTPIGKLILSDRPTSDLHKVVHIAERFSGNSGSLIYSNGAAESEKISLLLFDLLEDKEDIHSEVDELIKLVKKTIHEDYTLAKVLRKGIAFHYGNMPLLIRQEIERLFSEGNIKYLICTSTLLEGVNLPAKSIFIRKPTRGKSKPLNQNDFWNLAGRAGRWGQEFSGNIVCIEPMEWEIKPNPNKSKQEIKRAINIIEDKGEELLEFIREGAPRYKADRRSDLEFAFGYFYIKYILDKENIPITQFYTELLKELLVVSERIKLPDEIIRRNVGISPLAQQELFTYFENNEHRIEELIPVYPSDSYAFDEYKKLVEIIGNTISYYPPSLSASYSILLINWMQGKPLSHLIKKSYESYKKNSKYKECKTLPQIIREVMNNVENFVRFKFAKDSSCYIDILRYFLNLHGKEELLDDIPQLNLWLEFGVSQETHISLLSLGLTRNTVIELTKYITNTKMSKEDSLIWLKGQNLENLELSPIIIEDIKKIL